MGESMSQGQLWIIAAASGTGKTSLVKALLAANANLSVSISHTTRPPRPAEQNGVDYHFIDTHAYQAMVKADAFLEHAQVFDHGYGTAKASIEALIAQGKDVLLEIDWQGAQQVRRRWPSVQDIFILPPSRQSLETRLRQRATDSEAVIQRRLSDSVTEIRHFSDFRYSVINDSFDKALLEIQAILNGHGDRYLSSRTEAQQLAFELMR